MFKKKAKAAPAADATAADAPKKKRSKLKLILFILLPLILLGGGGYAGWMFFLKPAPEVHAEGEEHPGGVDPQKVAALALEAAAETSATYNFALAQLLGPRCGELKVEALRKASDDEAARDGKLVNLSWQAALRRAGSVTEVSCERMLNEIDKAEFKLEGGGAQKAKGGHGDPHGGADAGHGAADAGHGDPHGGADAGHGGAEAGHGEKAAEGHGAAPAAHGEAPAHGDAHAEKPAAH